MPTKKKLTVVVKPKSSRKKQRAPVRQQEITAIGRALRTLGGAAGTAVGGYFGNPLVGGTAGTGLAAALSKWLGQGDYTVSQNSLVTSMKASGSIPSMHQNDQSVVVRHKEYVTSVVSSTDFAIHAAYAINPGRASTFPWLNSLASNYQQYRIRGMVFHYVPTSGSAVSSTNNALGSVMMQTSYRASDSPPASKIELLNEYWSSEAMPSETFAHPIECNPNENPFNVQYVRDDFTDLPANDSPLLYDLGVTYVATQGMQQAGVTVGDIWVTYEIELKKPIISSNTTTGSALSVNYRTPTTPITRTAPMGAGGIVKGFSFTGTTLTIPRDLTGVFTIIVNYQSVVGITNPVVTGAGTTSNCSVVNISPFQDRLETASNAAAVLTTFTEVYALSKTVRGISATWNIPIMPVGSTGTIDVFQIFIRASLD